LYTDIFCERSHPSSYSALSFLLFIKHLVKTDLSTCQAVLQAGFLDTLLCMYACNFSSGTRVIVGVQDVLRSEILACGCSILVSLSQQPETLTVIQKHPISVLWPKNRTLLSLYGNKTATRPAMWRQVGPVGVAQRLSSLGAVFRPLMSWENQDMTELLDAYVDLVEFSK
jgi:hypothetical protein